MLTPYKDFVRRPAEAAARLLIRLKLTPNQITLLSLVLAWITCGIFLWTRNAVLFGSLMIAWGLFDLLDGTVARLTNRVTKFGSYLDAVCDRIFEASAVLTAAYVSGYWVLSFLLVVGATLISYAKARAAMEVEIVNAEWPDFMERTERDLIFAAGIIAWGVYPGLIGGHDLFFWTLAGLDAAVYATFLQRLFRARRIIESRR